MDKWERRKTWKIALRNQEIPGKTWKTTPEILWQPWLPNINKYFEMSPFSTISRNHRKSETIFIKKYYTTNPNFRSPFSNIWRLCLKMETVSSLYVSSFNTPVYMGWLRRFILVMWSLICSVSAITLSNLNL